MVCAHINKRTQSQTHMHTLSRSWLKTEVSRKANCCHHITDMPNRERTQIHTFALKTSGRNLPQTLPKVFTDMFALRNLWRKDSPGVWLTSQPWQECGEGWEACGKRVFIFSSLQISFLFFWSELKEKWKGNSLFVVSWTTV